jgi:hypothetical protein
MSWGHHTVMSMIDGVIDEGYMALFNDEISKLIRRLQVLDVDLRFLEHNLNLSKNGYERGG